ncbi:phage tail protein [Pseudomonas sp. Pseusp16]|uniref:phage tail protein n=1 Tax=Pseudomonas sp. Pseusp16 TaxID=3243021 RepID=UPI0039B37222
MIDQTSQFFAILTNIGTSKQANADALGIAWKITQMGVGDANGTDPIPSATQTALINERRRAPLNQLKVDPVNAGIIIAEQVIPEDVGGFWIREIGLYDADNDLVAVANCAPSFKPLLAQGSGRTQVVRINLIVSNSSNVELKIDPSVVLATRAYVDAKVLEEVSKLDSKQSVRAATTANIALTGLQTLDGIALVAGDRVLVKNQTAAKDNGLYVAAAGAWARASDADGSPEVTSALLVSVEQGTTQADTSWQLVTDGAIVLGNTALTFQNITQGFAPLASPSFSGTPTVPTAAAGTNTTQAASTAFVRTAVAGILSKSVAGGVTVNLTATEAGNAVLSLSGALTANIVVTVPAVSGWWIVENKTTGAYTLTIKTPAGTGVVVVQGKKKMVWCDGVNVLTAVDDLDSIALTGTPTVPTAAPGTNTTQAASTAFVQASVAALIAAAPGALDTLNELATALGNDPNFATTMTNLLAAKAPLASPALTGTPTAPTAATGTNTTQLATTGFVQQEIAADLATVAPLMDGAAAVGTGTKLAREDHRHPTDTSRAPLASPALTGTPTAPTAVAGTNTTQLASTAFVQAAIAALVASSPAALDTLNELATALGNDPNFATTMTNLLATKAPLASPALTGNPTAPTPAQFDADTSIATTAFVQAALGNRRIATAITASRSLTLADFGGEFVVSSASPVTLTLPSAATVANGASLRLVNLGSGICTLARTGADTFIGSFNSGGTATSFPLLFNDDVTVTAYGGMWLVVGVGAMSSNTAGTSGFRYTGGGLYEQWGIVLGTANPANGRWDFDVVFPAAFPNACLAVVGCAGISATDLDASDGAGGIYRSNKTDWQVGYPLTNKFEASVWYTDLPNNARYFSWRAIGK